MEFLHAIKNIKIQPSENLLGLGQNLGEYYKSLLQEHSLDEITSVTLFPDNKKNEIIQITLAQYRNYLYSEYPQVDREIIDLLFSIIDSFDEVSCMLKEKGRSYLENHRHFLEKLNKTMVVEINLYLSSHLKTDLFSSIIFSQISALNKGYLDITGRIF